MTGHVNSFPPFLVEVGALAVPDQQPFLLCCHPLLVKRTNLLVDIAMLPVEVSSLIGLIAFRSLLLCDVFDMHARDVRDHIAVKACAVHMTATNMHHKVLHQAFLLFACAAVAVQSRNMALCCAGTSVQQP